jgi:hypothetical protein
MPRPKKVYVHTNNFVRKRPLVVYDETELLALISNLQSTFAHNTDEDYDAELEHDAALQLVAFLQHNEGGIRTQ